MALLDKETAIDPIHRRWDFLRSYEKIEVEENIDVGGSQNYTNACFPTSNSLSGHYFHISTYFRDYSLGSIPTSSQQMSLLLQTADSVFQTVHALTLEIFTFDVQECEIDLTESRSRNWGIDFRNFDTVESSLAYYYEIVVRTLQTGASQTSEINDGDVSSIRV
jgi:type II secretory pathway component PulL